MVRLLPPSLRSLLHGASVEVQGFTRLPRGQGIAMRYFFLGLVAASRRSGLGRAALIRWPQILANRPPRS